MKTEMISKPIFKISLNDDDREIFVRACDLLGEIIGEIINANACGNSIKCYDYAAIMKRVTTYDNIFDASEVLANLSDTIRLEFEGGND